MTIKFVSAAYRGGFTQAQWDQLKTWLTAQATADVLDPKLAVERLRSQFPAAADRITLDLVIAACRQAGLLDI